MVYLLKRKRFFIFAATLVIMLSALFLCSCGKDVNGGPSEASALPTSQPSVTASPRPAATAAPGTVKGTFYDRGEKIGETEDLPVGAILNQPSFLINDDKENKYEFIGWDADGDGIPEEFPYTLNKDTDFTVLLKITPVIYHYDIYDRGTLLVSRDCRFNETIEYPEIGSYIDGDEVNIFIGWRYNGKFDRLTVQNVTENLTIESVFADTQVLTVYYEGSMFAKYLEEGETLPSLAEMNIAPDAGYVVVWYTDEAKTKVFNSDKMIKGNLQLYGRQESGDPEKSQRVDNGAQLTKVMDAAFLARKPEVNLLVTYDYGTLNDLVKFITENCVDIFGFDIAVTTKDGDNLVFSLAYPPVATIKSSGPVYTQLPSVNTTLTKSKRSADFDDFPVNKVKKTLTVNNSEALYYALENGMRPVIDPNAKDLAVLYETMKEVLRTYVSDDMSDADKVFAIYQYVVLSVTYDYELLEMVKKNVDTEGHRGYYLEGAFIDHLAVCDGFAKAFSALCRMEGIECFRVTGTKIETGYSHAWNKVKVGGKWFVVDTTSGSTIVGDDEIMTLRYFLYTDDEDVKINRQENQTHEDVVCDTVFDVYDALDIKVNSPEDAAKLLKLFFDTAPKGRSTFEIKLGYPVESDKQAVQDILNLIGEGTQVSYVGENGIYCFIYDK